MFLLCHFIYLRIMGSVLLIIFQFLNNSKRNARQPGKLPDSCPMDNSFELPLFPKRLASTAVLTFEI